MTVDASRQVQKKITHVFKPQIRLILSRTCVKGIIPMIFRSLQNQLTPEERGRLSGYLNWTASVDPKFLEALRAISDQVVSYPQAAK